MCQLVEIHRFVENHTRLGDFWQIRRRIPRFLKNRLYLIQYEIASRFGLKKERFNQPTALPLQPGDWVQIRSKKDILSTLNGWKCFEGCRFMDEMWVYCGKKYKVMKNVHRILDERSMKIRKCKNVVLLEELMCNGSWPFGDCDRSCYFLWKEAWLTKIQ